MVYWSMNSFKLVELFDLVLADDHGVDEKTYDKMREIATQVDKSGLLDSYLAEYVDATDGRFYLKEDVLLADLIREGC